MDRNELLESTMESWMSALDNSKQRGELVLVDWSSKIPHQETLERLKLDKDPRIRLVRVENEPFWILTIAYNHAAASISKSSTHIVKLDCDTFISSHFFQNISFTSDRYHAINVTGAKNENAVNLHGVSIIPSRAFQAVQGFDERIQSYGYEDEDLYQRLNRNGLIRTELDYSHMMHLSHAKTGSTSQNITRYDLEVETRVNQLLGQKLPRWSKEDTPSSFSVSKMSDRIFSARMVTRSQRNTKLFTEEQINQTIQEALKDRLIDLGVPSNILESPSSSTEYEKFWNSYKDGPMITIHVAKGLGHRIQSLVSGMAIARKTGRHLRVVWPVDGDFQARFEDLFDADGFDVWTRLDPREHKSPKLDVYNYLDSKVI